MGGGGGGEGAESERYNINVSRKLNVEFWKSGEKFGGLTMIQKMFTEIVVIVVVHVHGIDLVN